MKPAGKLTENDKAWFAELPNLLEKAVEEYQLPDTADWGPLEALSSQTIFEGVEVHLDSIVREKDQLIAPATVFVELIYDPNDEPVTFHDLYPARVFFEADKEGQTVSIDRIEVDTRSFYE